MALTKATPKRKKIVDELTRNILSGEFPPGSRLTSIRDMSEHFGVSISVVQSAMRDLTSNMLLECGGTSGFFVSRQLPQTAAIQIQQPEISTDDPVYIYCAHHNDLVWRYDYDSYAKIQERQIDHLLELQSRHPEFCFGIEQAAVLKNYVERHPERLQELRQLAADGKLEITGGFCIPDLNMISGESLVRNLLLGKKYYQDYLNMSPVVACFTDAFGMSAQVPQVLRRCGYQYLIPGHLVSCFDVVPAVGPFRWHALDDTTIIVHARQSAFITHFENFGMTPLLCSPETTIANYVDELKRHKGHALAIYVTEEFLINESLFPIVENANRTPGRQLKFSSSQEYFDHIAPLTMPDFYGEFNPSFSGCYTTRIAMKQLVRAGENQLYAAELLAVAEDSGSNYHNEWENLLLAEFHDAICGCHTDAANRSIREKLGRASVGLPGAKSKPSRARLFNPENFSGLQLVESPIPIKGQTCQQDGERFCFTAAIPACSAIAVETGGKVAATTAGTPRFSSKFFTADFGSPFPVICNREGKNVFGADGFGEILFRPDYGTLWAEYHPGPSVYRGRKYEDEKVTEIVTGSVFTRVTIVGEVLPAEPDFGNLGNHWTGFESLQYKKMFYFYHDLDYFKLKLQLTWSGCNTKIAIRFPVEIQPQRANALYDIPFGSIVRKPYLEVPEEFAGTLKPLGHYYDTDAAGKGDWPALNYVDYSDRESALAVANTGTPGHHIAGKNITVSLLRSGTRIRDGYMVPQTGSFDNGNHEFTFVFRPHRPTEVERAAELGKILNRPPQVIAGGREFPSLLEYAKKNLQISAIYREGESTILRIYETVGRQTTAGFSGLLTGKIWREVTMDGKPLRMVKPSAIAFKPFEIKTFTISKA